MDARRPVGEGRSVRLPSLEEIFREGIARAANGPPVVVDLRSFMRDGDEWFAALTVFREKEAWRGFIGFSSESRERDLRTADIFREDDPESIRRRFRSFDPETLKAFLRSVIP